MDSEERERRAVQLEARMERLKRLYLDGDILELDYSREREAIKRELTKLTVNDTAIIEASETLNDFPLIWENATALEKRRCYI